MSNAPRILSGKSAQFGEITGTTLPTVITNPGNAHTKGSWVQLCASTPFDFDLLWVGLSGSPSSNLAYLVDVAIGSSGNEVVVAANLQVDYKNGLNIFTLPVKIPKGSRIACRLQSGQTTNGLFCVIRGFCTDADRQWGSKIITIGADTSVSSGTSVDAGGSANTKGAWAQLTASLAAPIKGFYIGIGSNRNSSQSEATFALDIGKGSAASEVVILPNIPIRTFAASGMGWPIPIWSGPYYLPCEAGARLAARLQSSITDASDRVLSVVLYGFQ